MPRTRPNHSVDEHVGNRVRARRKSLGVSQSTLAEALGVTFQMIQRYEYGLCRISASTLYTMAQVLECPISYFFEGLPRISGRKIDTDPAEVASAQLVKTQYGRLLAQLFPQIHHRGIQRAIVELVRSMTQEEQG
jgi:transcriptional regulator with XRE-family HTH domain